MHFLQMASQSLFRQQSDIRELVRDIAEAIGPGLKLTLNSISIFLIQVKARATSGRVKPHQADAGM